MKCLARLIEAWYVFFFVGIIVIVFIRAVLERRSDQKDVRDDWDDVPAIVKFGDALHLVCVLLAVVAVVMYCLSS